MSLPRETKVQVIEDPHQGTVLKHLHAFLASEINVLDVNYTVYNDHRGHSVYSFAVLYLD